MARKRTTLAIELGRAIRLARVEQGYSQEAFAAHARFDRGYCSAIERGEFNLSLSTAARVALALGLSLHELFARAGV